MRRTPLRRTKSLARSPMRRASAKGAARREVRRDHRERVLAARPLCEWPDCLQPATDVHEPHTRGRGGSELDARNASALCALHHEECHHYPMAAAALGLLVTGGPARKVVLTDKHHAVRGWIADVARENGGGVSVEAIVGAWGAGVHVVLGELVDKGLLERAGPRALKVTR